MTYSEQLELLNRIDSLEKAGQHREAIALCEGLLDGTELPEFNLALARNHYALAARGNEIHAWPAMLAALDGIAKRTEQQADIAHAIGICRWVLSLFADQHRVDVQGFAHRHAEQLPGKQWWVAEAYSADREGAPPLADLGKVQDLIASEQHVRAANVLLTAAPSKIRHGRDAASVARETRYLLASLLSALDGEKIASLLSPDEFPPPGDHGGQHYDRYLLSAASIHREQLRARAAGAPGIMISALPKSASEFLSYTLAETLRAPVLRVTIGPPLLGTVHSKWVAAVLQGGAVTHDHFAASEVNLAALREGGLTEILVLVRDPRASFLSYEKMRTEYDGVATATRVNRERALHSVKMLGDWIGSWIRARDAGFPVRFVFFRELTADPRGVIGKILQAAGAGRFLPSLHEVLQRRAEQGVVSSNFRKGDDNAWRTSLPAELHEPIWELLPSEVKELLALER